MKKLLGVLLYFFVLHKHIDAKSGNLRTNDVKNEQDEKRKKFTTGWIPYYVPPKGKTIPIALLAALPEKTTFRKSENMRKDVKEEQEGEENVNSLNHSGEANDADFQFKLQIVEGADHSTDGQLEGGSSPGDAAGTEVPAGEVDHLEQGEGLPEEAAGHTTEHATELVAELVEEPAAVPVAEEAPAADDQNAEVPEEAQSLPVHEANEVSVEESQEGTPSVAEQGVDDSVPGKPADEGIPSQSADASVPNQPEDESMSEPDESNDSEVDSVEEASEEENFYHMMEEDDDDDEEAEMGDEEFEDDYDNVMHKINEHEEHDEHERETPSNDGSKYLTRADIVVMLAVRNMLSALNDDYGIMDFLTGFNPGVINPFYML
ncbi:Uncharacterized protein PCOAH_00013480 [Plasmodium coatneyi]|uniref:Merozoite surface protein 3 n=1 Tax=Plasmodium coatneyi TaxID=208452 RepID=A0A1B1DWP5_9APIC|nr:Uncharacterized protein PCOAH_00013480 [Plasmodium coatneyi]ANQ07174.1 Uncharacterized protein PCOAH_00013480 [Plasmodium coatneyi]